MPKDPMTPPALMTYSVQGGINSRTYECNLCGNSSPDLDAARAHHFVHVAGPELLAAMKNIQAIATYERGINHATWADLAEDVEGIKEAADSAILKAEPTKGAQSQ